MSASAVASIADVETGVVLAEVTLGAPPLKVFSALTSPSDIPCWWGADDVYRVAKWSGEVRPGGAWKAEGRQADGSDFSVKGNFLRVEPPRVLAHTWRADWDAGGPTTVEYQIEPTDAGARMLLRHSGFAGRPQECRGYADGWKAVLGWLAAYLKGARAPSQFFHLRLNSPRPTFPLDMTAPEREAMEAHFAYWSRLCAAGVAIVYGPVEDPKGVWGAAVVRVDNRRSALNLVSEDPAIRANLGFRYDVLPMTRALSAT